MISVGIKIRLLRYVYCRMIFRCLSRLQRHVRIRYVIVAFHGTIDLGRIDHSILIVVFLGTIG